ncbi:Putative neutral zinc metallopeptidase [Caulifigura coniformis]|uniref:Neutral zinc metallopeptidase n=2 Tax=Caulifigura coniformis TaxID=2527983 RepID=A0A517S7V8_9PLAN|nr:Putative neutral zinc metallopeptidase [Caulifigura coniformis]
MALGGGGMGILILALLIWFMGGNPLAVLQRGGGIQIGQPGGGGAQRPIDPADEPLKEMASVVLRDTEVVWNEVFQRQLGKKYQPTKMILFSDGVQSGCGVAGSETGPFYCPADGNVYLDLSFFRELEQRFDAAGDFAQAYVVAHEVGHHVQNLLGISDEVHMQQERHAQRGDKAGANEWSVRLELQADFLAGVWANRANKLQNILEQGDVEEAMRCAQAIGDDRLQKQARGTVRPDLFTHGTSAQRARWFRRGLETGDIQQGNALFELPYDQL